MQKFRLVGIGLALVGLIAVAGVILSSGAVSAQENVTYTVTIENLTSGQPMTPPVVIAHTAEVDFFGLGDAATMEVSQIAENGNNDPLVGLASGAPAVHDHGAAGGPVLPGESQTVTIEAPAGSYLSIVAMLICTNDGFTGVDSMRLPASGSTSVDANAYDAGSEQNTEDFADIVPPCQDIIGVSSDDAGTGMSNLDLAEGGVISAHAGIMGDNDLTVSDHGWTDPVARITVSAASEGLPASGTGFVDVVDSNDAGMWLIYLALTGAALVTLGGGLLVARRRITG